MIATNGQSLHLAWQFARRELRGGIQGFRVFLLCLIMGVAAIAAVGTLSNSIEAGLARDARQLLGGDVDLRLTHKPADTEQLRWLNDQASALSNVQIMRAMAVREDRENSRLVEVKAVDSAYPLIGEFAIKDYDLGGQTLHEYLMDPLDDLPGAVVAEGLLQRLNMNIGDRFRLGEQLFVIKGIIDSEPDRSTQAFELGPRVIVPVSMMENTQLIKPGSLIRYHYRVTLDDANTLAQWEADLESALPNAGWRVRSRENAAPNITRFIDRVGLFLTLVGLTALLIGGVGIGNAIRAYIQARRVSIATLKCVGAQGYFVFAICLFQISVLALIGVAIGLAIGAIGPMLAADLLSARLPVDVEIGFHAIPLGIAAIYGILVTLIFSIPSLDQARAITPALLFRHQSTRLQKLPRGRVLLVMAILIAILVAVALLSARDVNLAAGFLAGSVGALIMFRLAAWLVMKFAATVPHFGNSVLRMALANLHRPNAATASIVMSLGLGLSVLMAVALVEANLNRQVTDVLKGEAPGFYFIDIQSDQLDDFTNLVRDYPSVTETDSVPMLRGRIEAMKGIPVEEWEVPSEFGWILRGDRGLTWSREAPTEGSEVVEGEWWPQDYNGEQLISFDAEVARAFGLAIGDTMTINVLGRLVEAKIANLRQIDWNTLGINFVMVFSPGVLERAPQTHIATAYLDLEQEVGLERAVVTDFPNVSAIRVKEVLKGVAEILRNIGIAVRSIALVAIVAGVLVLAGALAAEREQRIQEAVVLKVLGATRGRIMRVFLAEFGLMGLVTALIAAIVATAAAWVVITRIMEADWFFFPQTLLLTLVIAVTITLVAGFLGTFRALSVKTAPYLRND